MELFETHCHLDLPAFDEDRDRVIEKSRNNGIRHFLIPATTRASWQGIEALCGSYSGMLPAYGLHPVFTNEHKTEDTSALGDWLQSHSAQAIGEIGLDFQLKDIDRNQQITLFERQLDIAEEKQLPVILHIRKAYDAILESLKKYSLNGGICHAFNGSMQQAGKFMDMGFKFGFGGMLTFSRSSHLRELAGKLPIESIVLETDAPDMTVASHQYERNSPEYLPEVLTALSDVRQLSPVDIARITTANAKQVLGL